MISAAAERAPPEAAGGVFLSFDAIETLNGVEERVKRMRADAAAEAKQNAANARKKGEQLVAEAIANADREVKEQLRLADEKARTAARALADNNENRKAALRARADARMDSASAFVVERIVNG